MGVDKRNTYYKLKAMLQCYPYDVVTLDELKSMVSKKVGSSDITISRCFKIMGRAGFLKDVGDCKFQLLI